MDDNSSDVTQLISFPGVNIQELIETHDLRNPVTVRSLSNADKEEKDPDDASEEFDVTAAFLGPNLWDKTLTDFKLEYLDLDEFLQDNGITDNEINRFKNISNKPINCSTSAVSNKTALQSSGSQKDSTAQESITVNKGNNGKGKGNSSTLSSSIAYNLRSPVIHHDSASTESYSQDSALSVDLKSKNPKVTSFQNARENKPQGSLDMDYKVNPNELALACVPGQDFDPACHSFSEDELKPQPMIKKSKKQFVPEEYKDDKYWARRRKNNVAAKRSREARRVKENQIVLRASYLEKENSSLRDEVSKLRHDNMMLKKKLHKYEQQQQQSVS